MERRELAVLLVLMMGCSSDSSSGPSNGAGPGEDAATPPADDAGGVDATTPVDSAAPPVDTGVDSAPPPVDAGSDAGRDLSNDSTKFFGASRCASAGVILCEDFESGTLDKNTWTVVGTAPVIDGVQKARGAKALHVTKVNNGGSYIKETKTFPAPKNTYYGRAFVYFDKLPGPPMTYAHWTFIAASGNKVSGEIRVSGQFSNGKNLFGVGTDNRVDPQGTGDWTNSDNDPNKTPKAVPTQQWLCIEWLHKGDTNETRFWWDATEHPSLYTSSTVHGGNTNPYILPQFTNVWLGWDEYQTSTETFEMWLDEIAIDSARIGCVI